MLEIRDVVLLVKQQPLDYLGEVNFLDRIIMKAIETNGALALCTKDIKDADRTMEFIDRYMAGDGSPEEYWPDMFTMFKRFHPKFRFWSWGGNSEKARRLSCRSNHI